MSSWVRCMCIRLHHAALNGKRSAAGPSHFRERRALSPLRPRGTDRVPAGPRVAPAEGVARMYDEITYEVAEPAALITLNRPHALNAWTTRMGAEVKHALAAAEEDARV